MTKAMKEIPHDSDENPRDEVDFAEAFARERQEVLRLRDLLIARDRELGTVRGQLAELQASPLNFAGARALVPGFIRRARARLRRSRS